MDPLRELTKTVTYLKTLSEKGKDQQFFDSSIAKHMLRSTIPWYNQFDSISYMLTKIEICEALVELFQDHLRGQGNLERNANEIGNNFIQFFLAAELAAHAFWNDNPAKA